MILNDFKVFSQNIWKNNFIINMILKAYSSFNIIFIQELFSTTLSSISSHANCEGSSLMVL